MKMSLKEALAAVLKDMEALSPDELRSELTKHNDGTFAKALREARQFLASCIKFHGYQIPSARLDGELKDDVSFESVSRSVTMFEHVSTAVNDNSYALAA